MADLKWKNTALAGSIVPTEDIEPFEVPTSHDALLLVAQLAEETERYDEMVVCMRKAAKMQPELQQNERNLLSVAYKNVLGSRRHAWRVAASIEAAEEEKGRTENRAVLAMMRKQFENEVSAVCQDLIALLDSHIIPASGRGETKVFFLKMKGDYYRYNAEVNPTDELKNQAKSAYEEADKIAKASLPSLHPTRLSLVLNLSVFMVETMGETSVGLNMALAAISDEEAKDLSSASFETPEQQTEAANMLGLLQENVALWQG